MSQKIVVKKNAPGWPAMVSSKFTADQKAIRERIKSIKEFDSQSEKVDINYTKNIALPATHNEISEASNSDKKGAALWLRNRSSAKPRESTFQPLSHGKTSQFAPKLVRQCGQCQMLYTTFHACQDLASSDCYCLMPEQHQGR